MSHVATVIKTKQKVISVNVNTLLQFENNESNLFQFLNYVPWSAGFRACRGVVGHGNVA